MSSPNTPGLRALQRRDDLKQLLRAVRTAVDALPSPPPPLRLKIAPDLSAAEKADIAAVALGERVDGLIVSNTTISRPPTRRAAAAKTEGGGLSGAPLRDLATETVRDMYALTRGKLTIVGAGGIGSGRDAYDKIRAGASAVQLYTALVSTARRSCRASRTSSPPSSRPTASRPPTPSAPTAAEEERWF